MGAHFLFTPLGSLGDLHPYIAVGTGLRQRGHTVTIATSGVYRAKVEGEGLGFRELRPDFSHALDDPEIMGRAIHPRTGTEFIVRKLFLPWIEQTLEDTLAGARDADLLVGHGVAFATPIAAELLKRAWISVALQPMVFLSAYEPPAISGAPFLDRFRYAGPGFWRLFMRFARAVARHWGAPVNRLRSQRGLTAVRNPILDDMFSPYGTQAWFSSAFSQAQKDWPPQTAVTGFPFYDKLEPGQGPDRLLARFLEAGPPPVVFTLGSSAVLHAGSFYAESYMAIRKTGCRAVVLTGRDPRNLPSDRLPDTVFIAEYAPYSELFPRAAAIVHQGGVGTTAQTLRSGRPALVVPYSNDQPDNAMRVMRLGAGRVIPRNKYRAGRVVGELNALRVNPGYANTAAKIALEIASEDGVKTACDGLEAALIYRRDTKMVIPV